MISNKLKAIEEYKSKIQALEQQVSKQLQAELARLPGKYGFASVKEFVKAVKQAAGGRKAAKAGGQKRRKRAKITPEMKQQIKSAVQAGKTGAAIAKQFGISLPSVQNVKKELGLVKARK